VPERWMVEVANVQTGMFVWSDAPWMPWYSSKTELRHYRDDQGSWRVEDTGVPTDNARIFCSECNARPWKQLCKVCQAPLCDQDKCHGYLNNNQRDYPVCLLCIGKGCYIEDLVDFGYQLRHVEPVERVGQSPLGSFLAQHRHLFGTLATAYDVITQYLRPADTISLDVEAGRVVLTIFTSIPNAEIAEKISAGWVNDLKPHEYNLMGLQYKLMSNE
jgi:hypothetical protein